MRDVDTVQMIDRIENLLENVGGLFLREEFILHNKVKELPARAELSDQIKIF
jgi:hypothetical protein